MNTLSISNIFLVFLLSQAVFSGVLFFLLRKKQNTSHDLSTLLEQAFSRFRENYYETLSKNQTSLLETIGTFQHQTQEKQENSVHRLKLQLIETLADLQRQMKDTLGRTQDSLVNQFDKLNQTTEMRLKEVGDKVEDRLSKGFEKTSETFTDIVKRLALIDDAQKKIHDLSSNVVSLQEILQDKRSRGAFGEIQLQHLIENVLPPQAYAFQYTLTNLNRVDCMLFLPAPTGNIGIDAKFPLDNYRMLTDHASSETERQKAKQLFRQDIKKHLQDIQSKYIIPGETSEGAIMFIPAEAVFAEIHAHFPDLVELAHQSRVWMTSPTTMMAILTTACAVLKDSATRKQVHVIQQHLKALATDFGRFEKRMDDLARHLHQANDDVEKVHTTAKKISSRFAKIERVELSPSVEEQEDPVLPS